MEKDRKFMTLEELSSTLGVPIADLSQIKGKFFPMNGVPVKVLRAHGVFVFQMEEESFSILISKEEQLDAVEMLEKYMGKKAKIFLAPSHDIEALIEEAYGQEGNIEDLVKSAEEEGYGVEDEDVEDLKDKASEAPVVRLVNLIIKKAVESRASDIHFEPFEKEFKVRFRIDGVLHEVESPPKRLQAPVISRIKLMAKMNIAERRLPQDGKIKMMVGTRPLDIRVSTIPTLYGESLVLRLLNQEHVVLDLDRLGFEGDDLKVFERLIKAPYGIILVTGPTGSGKTTTLYGALNRINQPDKKIITVEDPVEYQLQGVNQIQVKPKIGLTFANALRSILRQDPDVLLIGEIRDLETAEIAVQASLTGHLVFSTLHTNDAVGAVTRLRDMGIENFLISSSLLGVLAQRLVRVLCPKCKEPYPITPVLAEELSKEGLGSPDQLVGREVFRAVGCEECSYTGYRGRTGIFELLVVDDDLRRLILRDQESGHIKKAAKEKGMKTLREYGLAKVLKRITTVEEVLRVTG